MTVTATRPGIETITVDADEFACGTTDSGIEWKVARYGAMVSTFENGQADDVLFPTVAIAKDEFADVVETWLGL